MIESGETELRIRIGLAEAEGVRRSRRQGSAALGRRRARQVLCFFLKASMLPKRRNLLSKT